jgi:hypothetical protein
MTTVKAEDIALQAAKLVGGDREAAHGDKYLNHWNIAQLWNGVLRVKLGMAAPQLDPHDVANMMECLKVARRYAGDYNPEDYIDGAGYAAVSGDIRSRMEALTG